MKKLLLVLVIVGVAFVLYNRQRLFIRDPLGSVVCDGVKEGGAQVYINYTNDVLLENDDAPMYVTLVQHGQPIGTPAKLSCLHWVACLTDADVATKIAVDPKMTSGVMSGKIVEFRDGERHTVVTLH